MYKSAFPQIVRISCRWKTALLPLSTAPAAVRHRHMQQEIAAEKTIMEKQEEYNTQKEQLKEEYYTQKIK